MKTYDLVVMRIFTEHSFGIMDSFDVKSSNSTTENSFSRLVPIGEQDLL